MHNIPISSETDLLDESKNPRSKESRRKMAQHAATLKAKPFEANDLKSQEIANQVDKQGE